MYDCRGIIVRALSAEDGIVSEICLLHVNNCNCDETEDFIHL